MANRRVVYISEISSGSKFRLVADRTAAAAAKKKKGTGWASCAINDTGGNFQRPSFTDPANPTRPFTMNWNPTFGWQRIYPPSFSVFNLPCPARWNRTFSRAGIVPSGIPSDIITKLVKPHIQNKRR